MFARHVAAVLVTGEYSLLASNLFHVFKKKKFFHYVVFSKVFHVLVNLCDFVVYACEDTAPLKFGEVVFLSACVYVCVLYETLLSNICVWI